MPSLSRDEFRAVVAAHRAAADATPAAGRATRPQRTLVVPLALRLLSDQLTPVVAYRRLIPAADLRAPGFLLESVEGLERQARYSMLGAQPIVEVVAHGKVVTLHDRRDNAARPRTLQGADPFDLIRSISNNLHLVRPAPSAERGQIPACVLGGWFGYASYDTVRYAEPEKLDVRHAPENDRKLPDLHFGLYDGIVAFDHVDKLVYIVQLCFVRDTDDPDAAYDAALARLEAREAQLNTPGEPLSSGRVGAHPPAAPLPSNMTRAQHAAMLERALNYIRAGDIFQVVLGQRFERRSPAAPFDVYRALRAVNPSPYMVYMQSPQCVLVASSPEILCRVAIDPAGPPAQVGHSPRRIVTNRPLAGTRPRGRTRDEDLALERELLADEKERAEHVMLVDLGRNDVGRVAKPGTVALADVMAVERYSHVMHISSTVTGELRDGLDAWDALRATLPVGTISGAPKIRAMQIIDELEPVRRGPYGGGLGYVGLDGQMDIALALRTIVVPLPTPSADATAATAGPSAPGTPASPLLPGQLFTYHLQAAGGIVADSKPDAEYTETVNKAGALARAIELAETAFAPPTP